MIVIYKCRNCGHTIEKEFTEHQTREIMYTALGTFGRNEHENQYVIHECDDSIVSLAEIVGYKRSDVDHVHSG